MLKMALIVTIFIVPELSAVVVVFSLFELAVDPEPVLVEVLPVVAPSVVELIPEVEVSTL